MAWTKTSEGGIHPKYGVYSETLTTKQVGNGTSNWTSVIDFVPPGVDFTVIANTAATNLSASTHVELFVSYTKDAALAARYRDKVTPFLSVTSAIDAATKVLMRDVSARGQYPYYWLKVPSGGGSVNFKVIVGKGSTEVV
jgi:hypothetical protein